MTTLRHLPPGKLLEARYAKFRQRGQRSENAL